MCLDHKTSWRSYLVWEWVVKGLWSKGKLAPQKKKKSHLSPYPRNYPLSSYLRLSGSMPCCLELHQTTIGGTMIAYVPRHYCPTRCCREALMCLLLCIIKIDRGFRHYFDIVCSLFQLANVGPTPPQHHSVPLSHWLHSKPPLTPWRWSL